ncbi:hypothetical protein F5Y05DRAFT_389183 [Hypoxylon sp. FL0543]|nr:hypothetical protein F5Y05DRAFT_389183 [Hypoxylon sp. FL0543]
MTIGHHSAPSGSAYTTAYHDDGAQPTEGYGNQAARPASLDSYQIADVHGSSGEVHPHYEPSKGVARDGVHIQVESQDGPESTNGMTISWLDSALAIALFVGSVLAEIGHHIYYASLDNTLVYSDSQQVWAIRIGTGLALLARCGLVATIGMVAVQQTWATLRKKAMPIGGIDSMFDVLNNPWSFFNKDLLVHAKVLYIIAGISWILPLASVVTPATLTVKSLMTQDQIPTKVPYYNFSNADGWPIIAGYGYYFGVGPEISRLFTTTYTSNSYIPQSPPFPNATYDLNFWAPSYKCSNLSEIIQTQNSPTWSYSSYNYTSLESAFYGEIGPPQPARYATDHYVFKAAAPGTLNNMILVGANGSNPLWDKSQYSVRFVCQLYNTSYGITLRFDNGIQSIKENSIKYEQAQEWDSDRGSNSGLLNNGSCAADPKANNATVCPTYYLTHYMFGKFLAGKISVNAVGGIAFNDGEGAAPLFQSGLMDCPEIWNSSDFQDATEFTSTFQTHGRCHGGTLASAIESLSKNFTYSLMTYRNWQNVATTLAPVMVSSPRNVFSYDRQTLLVSYLASILVTLGCIVVGCMALLSNGYTGSTNFSSVLLTTRNPDLDRLAENNTLGQKPLPDYISETKLRFGVIGTRGSETVAGFGFDGTVEPLCNTTPFLSRRRGTEKH